MLSPVLENFDAAASRDEGGGDETVTAQAIVDLVHERDRLRRENAELAERLRAVNPILVDVGPGSTMAMVLARVVAAVARRHRISAERLRTGGRLRALVLIRNEAAWECRQVTPRPILAEVARAVGLTDHSSVIYAIKRHAEVLQRQAAQVSTPAANGSGKGDDVTR